MAKAVYRPAELAALENKVILDPPQLFPELAHLAEKTNLEELEAVSEVEEYTGPTADELRKEAEAFKVQWEAEKEAMLEEARKEAEEIRKAAEEAALQEAQQQAGEAQVLRQQAQEEADKIIAEARAKAAEVEEQGKNSYESGMKEAHDSGLAAGREEGYQEGKAEVERLIQRTQTVLERVQDKRQEILQDSEQQIVDLVLLITRKVVKVISETQKGVVVSNVVQALRKLKARGDVIIHVNMQDVKLTTEHTQDFIRMMEGIKNIQVVEDSSVDQGGCVIETEFGEVDARIASQLGELEDKILEISPIKGKAKAKT